MAKSAQHHSNEETIAHFQLTSNSNLSPYTINEMRTKYHLKDETDQGLNDSEIDLKQMQLQDSKKENADY